MEAISENKAGAKYLKETPAKIQSQTHSDK